MSSNTSRRSARAVAILTSLYAAALVLLLMFWARRALQVRTPPERIMEAALRLLPPHQFEATIDRFGPAGKEYALYATTAAMFVALVIIGLLALRFLRRPAALLVLGLALYLLIALVIMPLTGAGFFAANLVDDKKLANTVHFGISMVYATTLLLGRVLGAGRTQPAGRPPAAAHGEPGARRALLLGGMASLAGFAATLAFSRINWHLQGNLPLAAVPVETPSPPTAATASPEPIVAPAGTPAAATAATSPQATVEAATSSLAGPTATATIAASAAVEPTATPAAAYPEAPPARPLPRDKDGALLAVKRDKGQVQSLVQGNNDFYVVTKNAAGDPVLSTRDWRLIVDGAVNRPVQLDYPTLRRLPAVTVSKSLECISNLTAKCELTSFGCDLISTAQWQGVRLKDVLELAGGLAPGVVAIAAISADEYSSALPAEAAADPDILLAYAMNGTVLPREHGFPVRLLTPGRYGLKNAKWLVNLKPMTQPYLDWWGQRNWSQTAEVKTMSRIDLPLPGAQLPAGAQRIGGIAYAGLRGIAKVEFSSDGGKTWQTATLKPGPGQDTFAQWEGSFPLAAGATATLVSRATDGGDRLQIEQFSLPQPNGGAGWDSFDVKGV